MAKANNRNATENFISIITCTEEDEVENKTVSREFSALEFIGNPPVETVVCLLIMLFNRQALDKF